jgi:hypothetical protein
MPTIQYDITQEAYQKLCEEAEKECRDANGHAKALMLQGIKCWPVKAPAKVAHKGPAKVPQPVTNGSALG